VLDVLYHHAKFGWVRISPAARVCVPDFAMKALEYRSDFDPRASTSLLFCRFVVVHTCSTFSDCCQLATLLNAEVQKRQNWGVRRQKETE